MDEREYTHIFIQSSQSRAYYNEQEAAEFCQMEVQMLRRLQTVGLIEGIQMVEGERRYSEEDMVQLRRIRRLHRDLGVNLAGVEIILRLSARMQALQREIEQYRNESSTR